MCRLNLFFSQVHKRRGLRQRLVARILMAAVASIGVLLGVEDGRVVVHSISMGGPAALRWCFCDRISGTAVSANSQTVVLCQAIHHVACFAGYLRALLSMHV